MVDTSNSQDLQIAVVPLALTLNPNGEPTPAPTPTPVPNEGTGGNATPNTCGGTCGSDVNCQPGLTCYTGYCRNQNNPGDVNCNNKQTPRPTATPKPVRPILVPMATVRPTPTSVPTVTVTLAPTPTLIPTPVPFKVVYNPADVNYDGCVSWTDVKLVMASWLGNQAADVNGDGRVDWRDILYVIVRLGEGCRV